MSQTAWYADNYTTPYFRQWTRRCGRNLNACERIEIPKLDGTHGGADELIVDDFLRFLATGESDGAASMDARMSVATGILAAQSLRQGNQPMDVPAYAPASPKPVAV